MTLVAGQTVILPCECRHDFQDQRYGRGRRVHNVGKEGLFARCTVCGKEHTPGR